MMKTTTLLIALILLLAGNAVAGPPQTAANKSHDAVPAKTKHNPALICPVTGTRIASAKAAYAKETYRSKTYYFCCAECKPRFDKNRAGIIKNAAHGKYEKM